MSQVAVSKKVGGTAGRQLQSSPVVDQAISAMVADVRARSASITGVRGPTSELKESYEALMKRAVGD